MIEAQGLSRSFGGREVVREVTFRVAPGEVVGFLGPNGAGKTTTIRLLLGLLRPDGGAAVVGRPVGYLPEQFAGYDAMSVQGYLRFMARMKKTPASEVEAAMRRARVLDLARRPLVRLSKGQRQRVGLAQALLGAPPAFVLDEPMQGLDPKQVVDARKVVRSLAHQQGAAVLLSTHVLAEAAAICDRVVVIVKGRIVAEERPGEAADLEARFLRLVGESELSPDPTPFSSRSTANNPRDRNENEEAPPFSAPSRPSSGPDRAENDPPGTDTAPFSSRSAADSARDRDENEAPPFSVPPTAPPAADRTENTAEPAAAPFSVPPVTHFVNPRTENEDASPPGPDPAAGPDGAPFSSRSAADNTRDRDENEAAPPAAPPTESETGEGP